MEAVKMNWYLKEKLLFSSCRVPHCPTMFLSWMHKIFQPEGDKNRRKIMETPHW